MLAGAWASGLPANDANRRESDLSDGPVTIGSGPTVSVTKGQAPCRLGCLRVLGGLLFHPVWQGCIHQRKLNGNDARIAKEVAGLPEKGREAAGDAFPRQAWE